ncbi:hypothetical protein [Streptomyces sp. NPDC057428]|uniref:hypothetical protein n=1 Tax=Streptomyces sp. NPDC057428 TaxID=3346129 RepID=UPI0036949C04
MHFHIVPRAGDLPSEYRGPGVFGLLRPPEGRRVTAGQADGIALALRARLGGAQGRSRCGPGPGGG